MQQAIAVLDSGVGGLTVAGEIMRQLPNEDVLYFGDTARAPYGPRSPSEVVRYTLEIVRYLMQFQPKLIVLACNTATAAALDVVRSYVTVPVVGVIEPGARAAIALTRKSIVGVIGTEGTIRSGAYERALRQLSPGMEVAGLACPGFVPLVEQGKYDTPEARRHVVRTLAPLRQLQLDCLILGCTHYPYLSRHIAAAMGPGVRLIQSADETVSETRLHLQSQGLVNGSLSRAGESRFYCSGHPHMFQKIAGKWLKREITVTQVTFNP